jgi:hypothetical protein
LAFIDENKRCCLVSELKDDVREVSKVIGCKVIGNELIAINVEDDVHKPQEEDALALDVVDAPLVKFML